MPKKLSVQIICRFGAIAARFERCIRKRLVKKLPCKVIFGAAAVIEVVEIPYERRGAKC